MSHFNETCIFSQDFRKNTQISNFMKIRLEAAELFHADRKTDITKLIAVFRNFAKAIKNAVFYSVLLVPNTTYYHPPKLRKRNRLFTLVCKYI
jgi:hypothetical protein